MMNEQTKIRQQLERKIKQRKSGIEEKKDIFQYSNNFLSQLESMKQSIHSDTESSYKCLEGDELQYQLKNEKQKLNQIQINIDKLRVRMLQIIKEQDRIKESINEKRKTYGKMKEDVDRDHKNDLQIIEKRYQAKRQNLLKQQEQLIKQKDQLIKNAESLSEVLRKADRLNKQKQERYNADIKAQKQTYMAIERQKSNKYESLKIKQLKEQAIKETEPKLLAIIKSSNEDIKKSEEKERKMVQLFKSQYKLKLQKDLTNAKQRVFQQTQQQKQLLRAEIDRKNKQRYEQKERQLQQQYANQKEQYTLRIKQQQKKIRGEIQEFILRNKDSHNNNIDEMKQLKLTYESRLKKMNQNLKEIKQKKLKQYEQKYKCLSEQSIKEINLTSQQKFKAAQQKLKKDTNDKINKISTQISKQKNVFVEDIAKKFEKNLINQKNRYQDMIGKEKSACEKLQVTLIEIQKNKSKQQGKMKQLLRQKNNLLKKNQDLQRKIKNCEAQLQAYEQYKFKKNNDIKKKCEQYSRQKQEEFQKLKKLYLSKQEEKQIKIKELLQEFHQESNTFSEELQSYRGEIQSNISKRKNELKKIFEQNSKIEKENQFLQKQIEEESRKIRK